MLTGADVLVVGDRIAAVGHRARRPPTAPLEIDATGGIVMPGMIDTHRHMWQTAMRGYGADWTLTQYFVWYYLEHGRQFRPRGRARRQPAVGLGRARGRGHHHRRLVARPADASTTPRRRSTRCSAVPGRFVLAYGNIQAGPWEWTADPAVRSFLERRDAATCYGCAARLRRHRRPGLPGAAGLRGGPRARPAGHDARRASGARRTTTASG